MKKRIFIVLLSIFLFSFSLSVYAEEFVPTLIPVGQNSSVSTESFQYEFTSNLDNSRIEFSSIKNLSSEKMYVSVNILLFDSEKKNIGFLTYCSEKDISTDYSKFQLNPGESTSYYMNIAPRYFVEGKGVSDIKYLSILDDNKFCHIGGYTKYAGLTFDEISSGAINYNDNQKFAMLNSVLGNNFIMILCIGLFIGLGVFFIFGLIINSLHRKIYNKGTGLSFIPICNMYISVKCAFGPFIAKIYIIMFIITSFLSAFIPMIIVSIVSLFGGFSFLVVLFKLISKQYMLFIGDIKPISVNKSDTKKEKKKSVESTEKVTPVVPTVEEIIAENKEESLDLSYGSGTNTFSSQAETPSSALDNMFSNNFDSFSDNNVNNTSNDNTASDNSFINLNNSENNQNNNSSVGNNEEESELSKFFH